MSLINDALKRAQRERSDASSAATPTGGIQLASPPAPKLRPQLILVGAGALLGLLIALGAALLLRWSPSESSSRPEAEVIAVNPDHSAAGSTQPAAEITTPNTDGVSRTESPIVATAEPLITVTTSRPRADAPEPREPARPSLRMINTIEALRIAGVRASGADSRVLMNDRVYRVGDIVDHEQGIRITEVTANSLSFEDESGAAYTRHF